MGNHADIQIPDEADEKEVSAEVKSIAEGARDQHKTIVLGASELLGIKEFKGDMLILSQKKSVNLADSKNPNGGEK